jgi:hypothetical protein
MTEYKPSRQPRDHADIDSVAPAPQSHTVIALVRRFIRPACQEFLDVPHFHVHSSRDNERAIEARDWLAANGWDDVFLDLDPVAQVARQDLVQQHVRPHQNLEIASG